MKKYFWSILITAALIGSAWAGIVSKPNTFVDGTVASASQVNADFDTLYTLVNGNIDNANISGTAAIVFSKLDTATVAGVSEAQTFTNKTLTTPVIASFYQDAAKTKLMTVPAVASDTLVTLAASQTLTNKTLTAPVLGGSVTGTYTLAGTPTITSPAISSPTISGSPTAAGSTWTDLGTVTTAAFTTITNLGSVTTADMNGGTIDGVTIGGASAAAGTFTTVTASGAIKAGATSNVPLLVPGQTQNLGLSLSGTTLTISGADGTALSATNPAWVCFTSDVTPGTVITTAITANQTLNLNDIDGFEFGITASVNWANDMPFFIKMARSDTDAVAFFISRSPVSGPMPVANSIGDAGADPATDSQDAHIAFTDITPADYNGNPCYTIGAFRMQYVGATTRWVAQVLSTNDGFGQDKVDATCAVSYTMPAGQNGNDATKFWTSAGGATTLSFDTIKEILYIIFKDGTTRMSGAFNSQTANGGGTEFRVYCPYKSTLVAGSFRYFGNYSAVLNTTAQNGTVNMTTNGFDYVNFVPYNSSTRLNDNLFTDTADYIYFDVIYKAF